MREPGISVVVPAFNEERNIRPLYEKLVKVLEGLDMSFEIVFVNDGSTDATLKVMKELVKRDARVRTVTFGRNFGKANALSAGFRNARGSVVITMDADLQDDPFEIPRFIEKMDEGFDVVSGWKTDRKDPITKTLPSKVFNYLARRMSGVQVHDSNCGFKAYRREVVRTIEVYGEFHRYVPMIAHWRGFRVGEIGVRHHKRKYGRSKYGFERLFKGMMDLLTISFLMKYGRSPMYFFGKVSVSFLVLWAVSMAFTVMDAFMNEGRLSIVLVPLGILMMVSSVNVYCMGLFAEMMLPLVGPAKMTNSYSEVIENVEE